MTGSVTDLDLFTDKLFTDAGGESIVQDEARARLSGRETDHGVLALRKFSGENRGTGAVALAAPLAIPCHISASVPPDGAVFRLDVTKQGLVICLLALGIVVMLARDASR